MSNIRKFIIPSENRDGFSSCVQIMMDKCPLACWDAGVQYNKSTGEIIIEDSKRMLESLKNYLVAALKKFKATVPTKAVEGKQELNESDEASKNIAVESLKAVSETLDLLKQNVVMAQDKIRLMPDQDIIITKLNGLASIVDSAITDISESITQVTGEQTTDGSFIQEDLSDDDKGVEMDLDTAMNNSDKLQNFTDKGQNIIIKDDQ